MHIHTYTHTHQGDLSRTDVHTVAESRRKLKLYSSYIIREQGRKLKKDNDNQKYANNSDTNDYTPFNQRT